MVSRTMSRFSFSFWNKAIRVDDSGTVMETSFSEISWPCCDGRSRERERERVLNFLLAAAFSPFLEKCIFFSKRVRSGRDSLIRGFEEFELFD